MRFRKPKKLGLAAESWLRHDVRTSACTATIWWYLGADLFIEVGRVTAPLTCSTEGAFT